MKKKKCGFISIIGKPNAGKSTLLNEIVQEKVSIITHKAQTTRHQIKAVLENDDYQMVFYDTPGLEKTIKSNLNRQLNKTSHHTALDSDLIIFVATANKWGKNDDWALSLIAESKLPVILVINKIDILENHNAILPIIDNLKDKAKFVDIVAISASKKMGVKALLKVIAEHLPEQEPYPIITGLANNDENFTITEIIREQLTLNLHQEIPYELTVQIEKITDEGKLRKIAALIWVANQGQKKIVIGNKGSKLKIIGTKSRLELENKYKKKVHLTLWVKIKENWWNDDDFIEKTKV